MRYLLTISLIILCLATRAQNINTSVRDRFQTISINDGGTQRYASLWLPTGWTNNNTNHYLAICYPGNGANVPGDSLLDAPGRLFRAANPNGKWNAKVIKNNRDTALIAVVQVYAVSGTGAYDAYNAMHRKVILELGMDTAVMKHRYFGVHLSGGPERFFESLMRSTDTANKWMQPFRKHVIMSTTQFGTATTFGNVTQNGIYKFWFNTLDGNTGTEPVKTYTMYSRVHASSQKSIDSMTISCGHCSTFWDSVMTNANLNAPVGTSGPSQNRWRQLVDDTEMPNALAGNDQNINASSTTLTDAGSSDPEDGSSLSRLWTKVSGPSCTIASPSSSSTAVTGMTNGTYVFQLEVTDSDGAKDTDQLTVNVTLSGDIQIIQSRKRHIHIL